MASREAEPTLPASVAKVRRHRERAAYDEETLHRVLDEGLVAHVGVARPMPDGAPPLPVVLPMVYGRVGSRLYIHGSVSAGLLKVEDGAAVCVTVTLVRGLVLGRSVFAHSANYDTAVVFGRAARVTDEAEAMEALRAITEHATPGQWARCRPPNRNEMLQTRVLRVDIERASVKSRNAPPATPEADRDGSWAGVLPLALAVSGPPEADEHTPAGVEAPPNVANYSRGAAV